MKHLLFLLAVSSLMLQAHAAEPQVFLLNRATLAKIKKSLEQKEATYAYAYTQLVKDAGKQLGVAPASVTQKRQVPPSGTRHDYMSMAPYWFPNPDTPDGLPYVRKDGQRNPEIDSITDKGYMPKMAEAVQLLGLAYYFSGDERYAQKAAELVKVWFLNQGTRMNPNLNYAQFIKGRNDGRGAGLIESRCLAKVVDGVGLLQGSPAWTVQDHQQLQTWYAEFLNWMQASPIGVHEKNAGNNHGVFYDVQRLSYSLFVGNTALAKEVVASAQGRLEAQMSLEGNFPHELVRTIALHYSFFVVQAFSYVANMSPYVGVDFWNYTTPEGKNMQQAANWLLPYLTQGKAWTYPQIKPYKYENAYVFLKQCAVHFNDNRFDTAAQKVAPPKVRMEELVQLP